MNRCEGTAVAHFDHASLCGAVLASEWRIKWKVNKKLFFLLCSQAAS